MNGEAQATHRYTFTARSRRTGRLLWQEVRSNLIPIEGLNHLIGVAMKSVPQVETWYLGLYEGAYDPVSTITAATLPGQATECTAYSQAQRVPLVLGEVSAGAVDNAASPAEFDFTAAKTVRGGFITSAPAKGAVTGTLLSVVRFGSPKQVDADTVLSVQCTQVLTSA